MQRVAVKPNWIAIGGLFALSAVMLGAFGAHGLETRVTPHLLDVFKTGAYYQMVHALGLILIGLRMEQRSDRRLYIIACNLLTAGILLFSGSLYLLALTAERRWGMVTPLGGLCFMLGWAVLVTGEARGLNGK